MFSKIVLHLDFMKSNLESSKLIEFIKKSGFFT